MGLFELPVFITTMFCCDIHQFCNISIQITDKMPFYLVSETYTMHLVSEYTSVSHNDNIPV